ncbi:MAG: nucleoside deaminase [Proteobacteria bacterium]|nr:nucleoside deaminase [Pseudomonadota bacterium]
MPVQQQEFMRRAIALSRQKMAANCGGPFGAVIVRQDKVIAEGWNRVTSSADPTAHAEVVAIRAACKTLGDYRLNGCDIYTSCEPCPMCLAAIYWARLEHIYYANTRADAAAIGFDDAFFYQQINLPEEKRTIPTKRILPDEASAVFSEWLKKADRQQY